MIKKADASLLLVYKIVYCRVAVSFPGYISSSNRLNWHKHPPHFVHTVELQWLEHLWDHENKFETGVVRANEG